MLKQKSHRSNMKAILDSLESHFGYKYFDKKYFARIGKIKKRYGTETPLECIARLYDQDFDHQNLTHLLNTLEKCCQNRLRSENNIIDWESL